MEINNFFLAKEVGGYYIYLSYFIYQRVYFSELQNFAYTSEIDFKDLFFDFIYLRDFDFSNIKKLTVPTQPYRTDNGQEVLILSDNFYNFINSQDLLDQ